MVPCREHVQELAPRPSPSDSRKARSSPLFADSSVARSCAHFFAHFRLEHRPFIIMLMRSEPEASPRSYLRRPSAKAGDGRQQQTDEVTPAGLPLTMLPGAEPPTVPHVDPYIERGECLLEDWRPVCFSGYSYLQHTYSSACLCIVRMLSSLTSY